MTKGSSFACPCKCGVVTWLKHWMWDNNFYYIELSRFLSASKKQSKNKQKGNDERNEEEKNYNDVDIKRFITIYNNEIKEKWTKVTRLSAFFISRFNAPFLVHMMPKSWIIDVANERKRLKWTAERTFLKEYLKERRGQHSTSFCSGSVHSFEVKIGKSQLTTA